jgi:hypothetical protein
VFYLFAAILAWQLGGLPAATLALMRGTAWAFALCFAAITVVSWRYLFILPIAFSIVITLCLTPAAWLSAKLSTPPLRIVGFGGFELRRYPLLLELPPSSTFAV